MKCTQVSNSIRHNDMDGIAPAATRAKASPQPWNYNRLDETVGSFCHVGTIMRGFYVITAFRREPTLRAGSNDSRSHTIYNLGIINSTGGSLIVFPINSHSN